MDSDFLPAGTGQVFTAVFAGELGYLRLRYPELGYLHLRYPELGV